MDSAANAGRALAQQMTIVNRKGLHARASMVFVAVNLDPHRAHTSEIGFPLPEMGIAPDAPYRAEELLTGERLDWRGPVQYVHLDPLRNPALIFRVIA